MAVCSYPIGRTRASFAAASDVGRKRAHNEDSFHLPGEERLALVADGMGGHASGEVASRLAVDTVMGHFRVTAAEAAPRWPYGMSQGVRYPINRLVAAIRLANAAIHEAAAAHPEQHGMGTTIVATHFLADDRVLVAHVGDSRVYRLRGGRLEQLTEDHSLLNDWMRMKGLRADELGDFQQKNIIVRALGIRDSVQVDVLVDRPRPGDVYLLCSDGLTSMVPDDDIAETLQAAPDLETGCTRLVAQANERGGLDNVTVLLARIDDEQRS